MGYEIPVFAHLSMILAPDRSKLSKRHGATSVSEFEELGCLPEAIVNYLTLLGWSPAAEQGEMMTPAETAKMFSLDKVSKTAAVYDVQKLIWLNGQYIMQYDPEKLTAAAKPFLIRGGLVSADEARESHDYIKSVVMAVRERVKTLQELPEACRYFFQEIDSYDEKGKAKYFNQENAEFLLEKGRECLAVIDDFTVENTETVYRNLMEKLNIKGGLIIHPTRLALTGRTASPGLFEVMALLGKEKCLKRLDQAIKFIKTEKDGN
jgi:glutamyl/glutaminyl-tRNA synthetase